MDTIDKDLLIDFWENGGKPWKIWVGLVWNNFSSFTAINQNEKIMPTNSKRSDQKFMS